MSLFPYIKQFLIALEEPDGIKLSFLLRKHRLYKNQQKNVFIGLENTIEKLPSIDQYCSGQVKSPFDQALAIHFKTLLLLKKQKYVEAYLEQKKLTELKIDNSIWPVPVLIQIYHDLKLIAKKADLELERNDQMAEKVEDVARLLMGIYRTLDKDPSSKNWILNIFNDIIDTFFSLNNLKMCHSLIKNFEAKELNLEQFSLSTIVTYMFYKGRLSMFEGNFRDAEKHLSYAFQKCTRKHQKNKRIILLFLIPIKILIGQLPNKIFLERNNLPQFIPLVDAIRTGNLKLFNHTMNQYQSFFIQKGIFLILERTKNITYRNLFKKTYLILNKNAKITLNIFQIIFKWLEIEIDRDEIECILANLIFYGYIKGYISHQMGCLVLSTKNPFPSLKTMLSK